MDEFGVLVQSIGFKAHGKSAPMAKSKNKPISNVSGNLGSGTSLNDSSSLSVDELDGIFRSKEDLNTSRQSQKSFVDYDVFGGPVSGSDQYSGIDLDFALNSSIDGNMKSWKYSNDYDDFLGSKLKQNDPVDDLIGDFSRNSIRKSEKTESGFDDLIPGFEDSNSSIEGEHSQTNIASKSNEYPSKSRLTVNDDPFLIFESSKSQSDTFWPFTDSLGQGKGKVQSSYHEHNDFTTGQFYDDSRSFEVKMSVKGSSAGTTSNGFENLDDLDAIFTGAKQEYTAGATSSNQDNLFDGLFQEDKVHAGKQPSSGSMPSKRTNSSTTNLGNSFSALFGDMATSSEEFLEIEGEPSDRRRLRLKRFTERQERIAKALNEKNQRDFQNQLEQDEKHKLAESVDNDIRRWAAGKEGNLRALLSTLQQVLWAECGWHSVSLTDLITSNSVNKVYKRAALCVHPDKVQQRGANIKQKYIAEKVFDILKEAWNKFNAEELR